MIKTETATEINQLNLHDTPKGSIKEYWLNLIISEIGASIRVLIMVARGVEEGRFVGLTEAICDTPY